MEKLNSILKWVIIVCASLILIAIHWTIFVVFIGIVITYNIVKKTKAKETPTTSKEIENEFREFHVKVAGITYKNDDGSSREDVAFSCQPGHKLLLVRDPENPYDKDAVKIMTENNSQLGYLDAYDAKDLQAILKGTSKKYSHAEATFVEAGTFKRGKKLPYCTISIQKYYAK